MTSPYAWAILALVAIASLVYAIVCQQKNKEKKEFSYVKKSVSLIIGNKSKYEKLSVFYDGEQIEDLTVSSFTIWNSGNRTLFGNDMVETKELTISVKNNHAILDTNLIAQTEETNRFSIKQIDNQTVKIFFDYADKKDGLVLQVIHTGANNDLTLDCKIKGGKQIKNYVGNENTNKFSKNTLNKVMIGLMVCLFICTFSFAIFSLTRIFNPTAMEFLFSKPNNQTPTRGYYIFTSAIFGFYSFLIAFLFLSAIKTVFGIGIPKMLKEYSGLKK